MSMRLRKRFTASLRPTSSLSLLSVGHLASSSTSAHASYTLPSPSSSSTSSLFCHILRRSISDITGNLISGRNKAVVDTLDESIMNCITMQDDAADSLQEVIEKDGDCAMGHVLYLFQAARAYHREGDYSKIARSLKVLEELYSSGSMTERETYLSASVVQFLRGEISAAAKLIETSLMKCPHDAISLKLVQNCYMAMGDSRSTLTCMARSMHTFDEGHHLHGHMLGMLSTGYLENGLYAEADQIGNRAVDHTRGRDSWALHNLLNTFQICGRASEGASILEAHQSKHICTGQQLLIFNQGCLHVHNGNYIGAARAADLLIASLENSDVSLVSSFTNTAFLLWLISLHKFDLQLASMWLSLSKLLAARRSNSPRFPVDDVAHIMTLSMTSSLDSFIEDVPVGGETQSSNEDVAAKRQISDVVTDGFRNWFLDGGGKSAAEIHNESAHATFESEIIANQNVIDECVSVLHLYKRDRKALGEKIDLNFNKLCPTLLKLNSSYSLSFKYCKISEGLGDHLWSQVSSDIAAPLLKFANQQYDDASHELNQNRCKVLELGSIRPHRDILEQTMVEAYLRDDQLDHAKMLLCERTSLNANDSQAWRRLASVFGRLGHMENAQVAHYTAWQLGIGQGGFGGSS